MTIDKIHKYINDLLRKAQVGYRTPEQIDTAVNRGQYRVFNHYLPLYASSNEAKEALAPFIVSKPYGTNQAGEYTVPAADEFVSLISLGIQYVDGAGTRKVAVPFPPEDELDSRLNSQLLKPTLTNPVGEVLGVGSYRLHPEGVYAGTIRFFRKPKEVKYGYSQNGRAITFDSSTSQDLEWTEKYQDKVILAALTILGVQQENEGAVQIAEGLSKLNA